MRINSRSDALWHLADALSEDILNTGAEDLFAEVAEDHQNRRALATEFDRIFRRGLRRVRRQEYMERLKQFIDLPWPSPRFAMASIGALAVIAIASALYLDQPFRSAERQPTNLDSGGARPTPPIVVAEAPKVAPQALNTQRPSAASLPDLQASASTAAVADSASTDSSRRTQVAEETPSPSTPVVRSFGCGAIGVPGGRTASLAPSDCLRAADQGHLAAQWKVGRMYAAGDGVPHDDLRAFNYFSQIATAHRDEMPGTAQAHIVANAFVALGHYYLTGIPNSAVVQDTTRAREMFAYAASYFGDADAQYQLGRLYLDGTPSDPHQAARWLQLAATKGDCRAEAVLGDMLFQGQKVPRQAARGLMWLTLSKDCAGPEENWVKPLYDNAFHHASDDERAMAFVFLEDWLKGRRE
jgi:hypothetical protein